MMDLTKCAITVVPSKSKIYWYNYSVTMAKLVYYDQQIQSSRCTRSHNIVAAD